VTREPVASNIKKRKRREEEEAEEEEEGGLLPPPPTAPTPRPPPPAPQKMRMSSKELAKQQAEERRRRGPLPRLVIKRQKTAESSLDTQAPIYLAVALVIQQQQQPQPEADPLIPPPIAITTRASSTRHTRNRSIAAPLPMTRTELVRWLKTKR